MSRGVPYDSHDLFVRPVATMVAQVWDDAGWENACERWYWVPRTHLAKIATEGRQILQRQAGVPCRSSKARSTTPEQDARVIEAVRRLGSVWHAANEHGLKLGVVHRILRENGITPPRPDRTQVPLKAAETRRRRAAA
ncbi:hypothetical protein ACLBWX_18390 [Methylobacterium sp. M6A4_1b]